ncbi:hypothetical protein J7K43_02085 [Candidatus Calescamantes bacterium]|nr:hypothetical protein [Candidatus Calescamantes bacterium]
MLRREIKGKRVIIGVVMILLPLCIYSQKEEEWSATYGEDFTKAYQIFLDSPQKDLGYTQAIEEFRKVFDKSSGEKKLLASYMLTLCYFYNFEFTNAYRQSLQTLSLAKGLRGDDERVIMLSKLVEKIKKGEISTPEDVRKLLSKETEKGLWSKEVSSQILGFFDDAMGLSIQDGYLQAKKRIQEMKEKTESLNKEEKKYLELLQNSLKNIELIEK